MTPQEIDDYVQSLYASKGYADKFDAVPMEHWNRILVQSGAMADAFTANELAYEFAKREVRGIGAMLSTFAKCAEDYRAKSYEEKANKFTEAATGHESCAVCGSLGTVLVPITNDGAGQYYMEDDNDANLYVMHGLLRFESFDLADRITLLMDYVGKTWTFNGRIRFYFTEEQRQVPLSRAQASELMMDYCPELPDTKQVGRVRVTNKAFKCDCLNAIKYASLNPMTDEMRDFVMERNAKQARKGGRWLRERGIDPKAPESVWREQWRRWLDENAGGMFKPVTDDPQRPVAVQKAAFDAKILTERLKAAPVKLTDIPEGWEAVGYATGRGYYALKVSGGAYLPDPNARVQKRR